MSRDMQIGLLLVVGFLALVGGVLYYRIEHPDELENYLAGATATSPEAGPKAMVPDAAVKQLASSQGSTPPATATPHLELPPAKVPALDMEVTPPANPVTLTAGQNPPTPVVPDNLEKKVSPTSSSLTKTDPSMGTIDLSMLDQKPVETKTAPQEMKPVTDNSSSTTRTSLPEPPPGSAPDISLPPIPSGATPPFPEVGTKSNDLEPTGNLKTHEVPVPAFVPPALPNPAAPIPSTQNSPSVPPDLSKSMEMPQPPVVPIDPPKENTNIPVNTSPVIPASTVPASSPVTPVDSNPPPLPPQSSEPATPPVTPMKDQGPPLFGNTSSPPSLPPLVNTTPETVIRPEVPNTSANSERTVGPAGDVDNMRSYAPRVGLGKPLTETEATQRERRWAENAGTPAPVIPATSGSGTVTPGLATGDRRVVRDTYIPRERVMKGETFSSLSQLWYNDVNYAVALAAYNKEEGFVEKDQPEPNQYVAKPNREILEQRYPQYIRRLTPSGFRPQSATLPASSVNSNSSSGSDNYKMYRVGKGEQLFEVAKKTLGDGYRWAEIYTLNKDQLRESTELRPDMILKIPAK
ncbi:MAG TPA: LysM peptidoglycan-binding domain-containing protein [Gemmatales bacterium]|nr:LysM peptidoglycan-binding domain-containing protein [Gemmatales bacterium]